MTEAAEQGLDARTDAELIAAVRRGDTTAYGRLYERHLAAAKRAATYLTSTVSEREDLVAEAFTRVLQVLRSGRGPASDFRPYLLVTMRHAAINAARRGPVTALYGELPEAIFRAAVDDPVDARVHGDEAASAFAGLPERWRVVLWHTEVEGASPAAIAPLLGMTPNGVAALAYRAREGLRQAYLRQHVPVTADRGDCRVATEKLAAWVRRTMSAQQRRKITAHLDQCARCRELAAGLTEVNGGMRAMFWLSALKGAFTATTAKVGTAAAIAAIAAVVAGPAAAPDGGRAPSGPVTALPPPTRSIAPPVRTPAVPLSPELQTPLADPVAEPQAPKPKKAKVDPPVAVDPPAKSGRVPVSPPRPQAKRPDPPVPPVPPAPPAPQAQQAQQAQPGPRPQPAQQSPAGAPIRTGANNPVR